MDENFARPIIIVGPFATSLIVELRRPEGLPSGAPYSYKKEKETFEKN